MTTRQYIRENFAALAAVAALAVFAALVSLGLHGASLGCWDDRSLMPPDPARYSYPSIGTPRWERADDWNVSMPQILAQCESPDFFPRINKRVDMGRDMFVSTPCNPVWDATAPAQPHNWGYFLFGAERGLAWSWWLRFLGLPVCAFLALRRRLGGDKCLAATGAAVIALGAPTQWWDTSLPYILLYGFASLAFLDAIRDARRLAAQIAAAVGLSCSASAFFLAGYPPFAFLLLPFFAAMGLPVAGRAAAPRPKSSRLLGVAALAAAAAIVAVAVSLHADTLRIVAGSSYPGSRLFRGGSAMAFLRHAGLGLLGPALPFAALRPDLAPFGASNPCNAARWFAPAIALVATLFTEGRWRPSGRDWFLLAYAAVLALWAATRWPAGLADAVGLGKIDPRRAEVVLGFVLVVCSLRALAGRGPAAHCAAKWPCVAVAVASAILAVAAALLPGGAAAYPSMAAAVAVAAFSAGVAGAASWGLAAAHKLPFCISLAVLSILSGVAVHPLSRGIAPLRDKPFAEMARSIDRAEPGRWMANTSTTGNFLLAQGLDCIAGAQAYAVPGMWNILDPAGKDRRAWNRYAHTIVDLGREGCPLSATSPSRDRLRYTLDEGRVRALGIRHVVWSGKKLDEPWLRYDGRFRLHFFYTVVP